MRVTVGRLKGIISEATATPDPSAVKAQPTHGFDIGGWYVIKGDWDREEVCRLDNIINTLPNGDGVVHYKRRHDGDSRQNLEFWAPRVLRKASAKEIKATQAQWKKEEAHASSVIDTSREGT